MQEEEKSVEPSPLPEVESKTKSKRLLEMKMEIASQNLGLSREIRTI